MNHTNVLALLRKNILLAVGLAIHALITLGTLTHPILAIVMGAFLALNVIGLALIASGQQKKGAWVYIVGCVGFVPIGILGMLGARGILNEVSQGEFELRRAEATT